MAKNYFTIKIVVGSWGSYNEGNERGLGSEWLDLADFEDWDEIAEELKKEGFDLDGLDEELFIQDIETPINDRSFNVSWDNMPPKTLFETFKNSGALDDEDTMKKALAFIENYCWDDFEQRVINDGELWGDNMDLYENTTAEEWEQEITEGSFNLDKLPSWLQGYIKIDYEQMAQDDDNIEDTSLGLLVGAAY